MSHIVGMGCLAVFMWPPNRPLACRTLFTRAMLAGLPYGLQAGAHGAGKVILRRAENGARMPRYRPPKRRAGDGAEPYAMTLKAPGTDRNLTHSCSPMYSPSTWNARGRLDLRVSSA
jgi:hypothetical protein